MRKDLRIGLAIGLVLLAVLVVYLLIPGGNDARRRNQASSQQQQQQTGAAAMEGHDAATGGEAAEDSAQTEPPLDGPGPGMPPEQINPPKDQSDVFAGGPSAPGPADAGNANGNGGNTANGPKPAAPTNENNTDWANLLYAPLRTTTPPAAGAAGSDSAAPPTLQAQRQATGRNDQGGVSFKQPPPADAGRGPAPSAPRTHTVQAGETFSKIAKAAYGSERYYLAIQQANPNIDPDRLKIGDVINLPDRADVTRNNNNGGAAEANAADRPIDEATEYRVQSGDSLQKIATKRFGSMQKWQDIYELNRDKIGPDPARLKVNTLLKMPAGGANSSNGNTRAQADRDADAQTAGARSPAGR